MPGFVEDVGEVLEAVPAQFSILKQRVDFDVDWANRALKGSTELIVQPLARDLKHINLHCRQCRPTSIEISGIAARWEYDDPYRRCRMTSKSTAEQHAMLKSRIEASLRPTQTHELKITIPPKLKIQEVKTDSNGLAANGNGVPTLQRQETDPLATGDGAGSTGAQQGPSFLPIKLTIEFEVDNFRNGLQWVGCTDGDRRYPYLYTRTDPMPGNTSCIFPCLDDATSRCSWEFAIKTHRTLGDAFRRPKQKGKTQSSAVDGDVDMKNGDTTSKRRGVDSADQDDFLIDLGPDEAAMDLVVLCVGDLTDDIADSEDDTRHTLVFSLNEVVTARHIAFAIGPFETVDLSMFRAPEDEEKLGQTAIKVYGYCLPGRVDELENTCVPICQAVDTLGLHYGRFPFTTYQMLFVDDLVPETTDAAGLTLCSVRLLFPQDIIEPLDRHTRILVRAVSNQWSGVNVIPRELTDSWVTSGIAGFMTDVFMKKLTGNNEYRWQQKLAAEKVYELDVDRPSIYHLGALLHLDPSIREFVDLKAALVLGILDRRLIKSSGSTGVMRIISKIFLNAKTGTLTNAELSTADFQRTCERLGHNKLESFFKQWVMGAGCPIFSVSQRFNKKKTVVEMTITQMQLQRVTKPKFEPSNFMREIKEHVQEVWAPETQAVFTGPMTIRIHEADGTPYEHIVEIREAVTKLEIQYNTKYKRLKRSKRQKERATTDGNGEGGDESLNYCLGDILDSAEDLKDWKLAEWSAEDEERMGQESYEWIRMDADFEWIGKIHLFMPSHMYISQLQQDRDLVAQYESMRFILGMTPHHVSLTLMVRTLMDTRYFHGIRVMAAEGIATLAKDKEGSYQLQEIGQYQLEKAFSDMFCDEGSVMPRPNDFSNRVTFIIQCAIPRAMSMFRDADNRVPRALQQFFVDKLKFNDNSDNPYSDCHYVATLMKCLTDSLVVSHREVQPTYDFNFGDEDTAMDTLEVENPDAEFEAIAIGEIERYRRIDEWVVTYQNIYSTTAIECLQKLTTAGIVKDKTKELLQYTRPSTAENVRLAAFRCLNEIGLSRKMPMLRHLIHSIVDHPSPYFRDRLLALFGEALGHIALDDVEAVANAPPPPPVDGLVLEQEPTEVIGNPEAARKATPEGAIITLRSVLNESTIFKDAIWYAATSPDITIDEVAAFCDIAALVYDAVTSSIVCLKLPRPYRCQHLGKGKMRFYRHGTPRERPKQGMLVDDWVELEALGLKYTGPLASATKRFINERKNKAAQTPAPVSDTQQQIALLQAQIASVQASAAEGMLPPPPVQTPSTEKSGFKISLGGTKRKMSVDISQQDTPKVVKLGKLSTPKNTLAAQRKSSTPVFKTPAPAKHGPPVVLRFRGESAKRKSQDILASIPRPTIRASTPSSTPSQHSGYPGSGRAATPNQYSSSFVQPKSMFSPPSSFASATPQPPKPSIGSFRSYGPVADATDATPHAAPTASSPTATRRPSDDAMSPTSLQPAVLSPGANGAPAPAHDDTGGAHPAPPPLKRKITLKLGKKSSPD